MTRGLKTTTGRKGVRVVRRLFSLAGFMGVIFSAAPAWSIQMDPVPIGTLDTIDGSGVVAGWAFDEDVPEASISVHFYIEGNVFIGDAIANGSRPDVNLVHNVTGDHGFVWKMPSQYRDGIAHELFVYAINIGNGSSNPLLSNAPKTFMLNPPSGTITVTSTPSGARVWYRVNSGEWTDSGTETPHTWSGIPVGNYDITLKKKGYADAVVPAAPLTEGGNLTLYGTLKVLPLAHVKHFGMVHSSEASFPEVAALDSINLAMVGAESDFDRISSSGKKAIMSLQEIFFSSNTVIPDPGRTFPERADYVLRGDHVSRWKSFVQKNNLLAHTQKIGGFYLVDEPYWNNLTYEDIQAAAWLVKQDFPTTPIAIVEAYPVLDHQNGADLRVPNMVDWVGFDKYNIRHPASDPSIVANLAEIKSKLTPKQRIIFIGDAFWSPTLHGANGITQEDMVDVFTEQIELVRAEPLVVAFVNFLWDTPLDVPEALGAGKLPLSVRETYASVGRNILANPVGDRVSPIVSITAPIQGALVAETSSVNIEVNVQDETALGGVEFYVNGGWIGTSLSSPFRWTFMANTYGVGTHRVEAIAYDAEGNSRLSAPVSITVQKTVSVANARSYPSPFKSGQGVDTITFDRIPEDSTLRVFSIDGRLVKTLPTSHPGVVQWDVTNDGGSPVASGVYTVLIEKDGSTKSMKVIVQR